MIDKVQKVRHLQEELRRGEITFSQFEEKLDIVLDYEPVCPSCSHRHDENTQCSVILFDGMQLLTTCTCIRHGKTKGE